MKQMLFIISLAIVTLLMMIVDLSGKQRTKKIPLKNIAIRNIAIRTDITLYDSTVFCLKQLTPFFFPKQGNNSFN